eukprot:s907_g19.t2
MTEFAEPAFAYTHTALKGNPKWQRVIVWGKTEGQDTYVVFTGTSVMFKPGFGGRIVPTKRAVVGQPASFQFPQQPILESPFHDPAAEDVKRKAAEEKLEEHEMLAMALEEKSRRDEQQVEVIDVSVGAADAMQLNAEELASSSNRPMQSSDVVVDSVFDDDNADTTHVRSSGTSVVIPPQVGQSASDSTI